MKKIMLVFAAFVAMTFAACGNGAQPAAEAADSTNVDSVAVVDSSLVVVDSLGTDSAEVVVAE